MTEQTTTTTPAALNAELDEIIAEAESDEKAIVNQAGVDATDIALQYANDYSINLSEVKGTGKDGRVTVPDVEKFKKALDAKAEEGAQAEEEAQAEADHPVEEGKKGEDQPSAKTKPKKKAVKGKGTKVLPALPNVFVDLTKIHIILTTPPVPPSSASTSAKS